MKVLMFGWEFPPCISGGLGTACHGLTRALAALDVRILFVLPRCPGERWPFARLELRGADEVGLPDPPHSRPAAVPPLRQLAVPSVLTPYLSAATYRERLAAARRPVRRPVAPDPPGTRRLAFAGQYGGDLFAEVSRYAEIGGRLGASERFDVIHAHDWMTYPAGVAAQRASGRPLICHCHATEFDRAGDRPNADIAGLERYGLEQADRVFAVSQRTKDMLVRRYRLPAGKIAVVHNAVAKEPGRRPDRRPRALDEKVVLFLGRVTQQKGPEYFVEAARLVLRAQPGVRFVMAGAGDLLPRMIERVAELRLADRFHFTGFLQGPEVADMFARSDVYVMPSVSEPFGISAFEAMLHHVPVIVSHQSGVTEVLPHAVKVDCWDVAGLAAGILRLLGDEALAGRLAAAAARDLDGVSWDATARLVLAHYRDVAAGAPAGGGA